MNTTFNMTNTYGLRQLPPTACKYIWNEATKIANWESPTEKGERGSTMLMEWVSFASTPEEWVQECKSMLIDLPHEIEQMILNMDKPEPTANNPLPLPG